MQNNSPKTVLCYGDSNTWGWNPLDGSRYPPHERWPGMLAAKLGPAYHVIEEGLSGRTTNREDPVEGAHLNGAAYLIPCLASHAPIDLIIIALGGNDLKARFAASPADIAQGVGQLVEIVQRSRSGPNGAVPRIILVTPAPISRHTIYGELLAGAHEKLPHLSAYYAEVAQQRGCAFVDLIPVISPESKDGVHLEVTEHRKICDLLLPHVKQLTA